jgi:hypothetical protein
MDIHWTKQLEICLEQRPSSSERMISAAAIISIMALALGTLIFLPSTVGVVPRTLFAVFFCGFLGWGLLKIPFGDNVRWTIRYGQISIEREAVFGRKRLETIVTGEITETSVQQHDEEIGERYFRLKIPLRSGKRFQTPAIKTEADARALEAAIRVRLQVVDAMTAAAQRQ